MGPGTKLKVWKERGLSAALIKMVLITKDGTCLDEFWPEMIIHKIALFI